MYGEVVYRKLSELKKLPNNPRVIKDKQFEKLVKSIKDNPDYFNARPIILSNRTGELVIIAGNQRYEAAKVLKMKEVPTFLIENLSPEREREIIIRDNVSNGNWNYDILANEWDLEDLVEWGVEGVNLEVEVEEELEKFSLEDNEIKELYIKVSKHWFDYIHREIRTKIKESELNDEVIEMFAYVMNYYNYCKTSKKRMSLVIPMPVDYCRMLSIDINKLTEEFQMFLYEKYNKRS